MNEPPDLAAHPERDTAGTGNAGRWEPGPLRPRSGLARLSSLVRRPPSALTRNVFSRTFLVGRLIPLMLGAGGALAFGCWFNADSISPVRAHTNYLERISSPSSGAYHEAKIVFVGSSLFRTNIDLPELKRYLATHGYPRVQPVSLGVLGFNLQGSNALLDRLLEIEGLDHSLSLVLVDQSAKPLTRVWEPDHGSVPYQWLWCSDPAQIVLSVETILGSGKSPRENFLSLWDLAYHLQKGAFYSVLGSVPRNLSGDSLYQEEANNPFALKGGIDRSLGTVLLSGQDPAFHRAGGESWRKQIRARTEGTQRRARIEADNDRVYGYPFTRIAQNPKWGRVGVISVLSPTLYSRTDPERLDSVIHGFDSGRFDLWDFSLPDGSPALWTHFEERFDAAHFNRLGARRFARDLGRRIVSFYKSHPGVYNGNPGVSPPADRDRVLSETAP